MIDFQGDQYIGKNVYYCLRPAIGPPFSWFVNRWLVTVREDFGLFCPPHMALL